MTAQAEGGAVGGAVGTFRPRLATALLGACMFFTGAAGLVNEYILSTVATYILGSSIEQFSVTIALMMAFMGIAGWFQKFLGDALLVEKFVAVEVLLALVGGWAPLAAYASFAVMEEHFPLVQYGLAIAIGALIGLEIPLVMRINERYADTLRANIAGVLSWDYVGSFVGALVWTYWLLRTFPLTEISFYVAGTNFIVALVATAYFWRHGLVRCKRAVLLGGVVTVAALAVGLHWNRAISTDLEQRLYDSPIVHAATTKYQRLVVTHEKRTDDWRLYINGNLQFSSLDEDRYHETLVHPAMLLAARREHVLVLGGGDGLAMRRVLQHPEVRTATLVDLDPDMVRLARDNPVLAGLNGGVFQDSRVTDLSAGAVTPDGWRAVWQATDEERRRGRPATQRVATVRTFNVDADRFVGALDGARRWDVVIVDFPDPNAIELAKLYSKEFYMKLRRAVAEDGMVVVQATSPYHARESYLMVRRTMEAAGFATLPFHVNVPSFGDWGFLLAWTGPAPADAVRERLARLRALSVETTYLTPEALRAAFVFGARDLVSARTDINTLMQPALLDVYVRQGWLVN